MTTMDEAWQANGKTAPYAHQISGLALLQQHKAFALFWEMGCGKSAPVCVRIAMGFAENQFSRVLIVCPKNALDVWPHELATHAGIDSVVVVSGSQQRRQRAYKSSAKIFVVGFETARADVDTLLSMDFGAVVVDEAHRIKTVTAKTSRAVRRIGAKASYRYALTGTPAPNSPIDVCGILAFLDPAILGTESITALRARYCVEIQRDRFRQIVGHKNLDDLAARTATVSHRITKKECLDLPPKIFETRAVTMTTEQARIYRDVKNEAVALFNEGVLSVANILAESLRLLQIVGGFICDNEGVQYAIPDNPKITMLVDLVSDLDPSEPVIVWCSFVAEVQAVAEALSGFGDVVLHYGEISHEARRENIERFRNGDARFFVATPQSAREAITLTNCATMIYYSRTYNLLDWSQSQDRSHRIGQDRPLTIVSLVCHGTIDDRVAKALERKESVQEIIARGGDVF